MKNKTLFSVCAFALYSVGVSISSLSQLSFDTIFDHKTWKTQKPIISQQLNNNQISADIFVGKTIIGLDFSGMNLQGKDFTNCTLVKVNLAHANLTNTIFHNTKFKDCNLIGAFFKYSIDSSEKEFKIKSNSSYDLVKQYSQIMNQQEEKEKADLKQEVADLTKQAELLNHIFSALTLFLHGQNLKGLNLIGINFQNIAIDKTQFSGARLTKDDEVPSYKKPNELFKSWKNANNNNTSEKNYLNKLIHAKLKIFNKISNAKLKEVKWKGLDLTNADLIGIDLQNINLSEVNLRGANLLGASLKNTTLTDADLTGVNLNMADLQGARFSQDFTVPIYNEPSDLFEKWYQANKKNDPCKKFYNILVTGGLNIFKDISKDRLQIAIQEGLDFKNTNLEYTKLEGITISGANLENASLSGAVLSNAKLINMKLANIELASTDLSNATLQNINIDCAYLMRTNFRGAKLQSISFKGAILPKADFTNAILENVDFYAAEITNLKLSDTIKLPTNFSGKDDIYIEFYHSCPDPKAKALLKIILESRGHSLD